MGQVASCSSAGSLLMVAASNGDLATAKVIVKKQPSSTMFISYKDKSTPLLQSAASGHLELVQLILETCLMVYGPDKAKRCCLDRPNIKNQTALQMACKHGHTEVMEYLIANGADPTVVDKRRYHSCLHLAALYGHTECVDRLLSARHRSASEEQSRLVGQVPCPDPITNATTVLLNCCNGWGVTALHIAVFQGGLNTARTLLKHSAQLDVPAQAPRTDSCSIRCVPGSNVLHIAAQNNNVNMVKLLLEAQESHPGLEMRSQRDAEGMRPQEYARRSRNLVLAHLLDERLPVHLLRQVWLNYSVEPGTPPRHQTLGHMLQKLKLVFSLEVINAQRYIGLADAIIAEGQLVSSTTPEVAAGEVTTDPSPPNSKAVPAAAGEAGGAAAGHSGGLTDVKEIRVAVEEDKAKERWSSLHHVMRIRGKWVSRVDQIQSLLKPVTVLNEHLQTLLSANGPAMEGRHSVQEVLDFILCLFISNRNVSAVLHAAKRLVSSSGVQAAEMQMAWTSLHASATKAGDAKVVEAGRKLLQSPSSSSDAQHSVGLLLTALKAVETCLHAAVHLADAPESELHSTHLLFASPQMMTMSSSAALVDTSLVIPGVNASTTTTVTSLADSVTNEVSVVPPRTIHHRHPHIPYSSPVSLSPQAVAAADISRGAPPFEELTRADPAMGRLHIVNAAGARGFTSGLGAAHWSSHLHTLIAQLQWDISVQRTTRKRRVESSRHASSSSRAAVSAAAAAAVAAAMPRVLADPARAHLVLNTDAAGPVLQPAPSPTSAAGTSHLQALDATAPPDSAGAHVVTGQGLHTESGTHPGSEGGLVARASFCQAAIPELSGTLEAVAVAAPERDLRQPSWDALLSLYPPRASSDAPTGSAGLLVVQPIGDGINNQTTQRSRLACISTATPGSMPPTQPASNTPTQPSVNSGSVTGTPECGSTTQGPHSSKVRPSKANTSGAADTPVWQQAGKLPSPDSDVDSMSSGSEQGLCAICMDAPMAILVTPCQHGVCVNCALQLTIKGKNAPCCPFCRCTIVGFEQRCASSVTSGSIA